MLCFEWCGGLRDSSHLIDLMHKVQYCIITLMVQVNKIHLLGLLGDQ